MKNNCQLWCLEGTQKSTELKTKDVLLFKEMCLRGGNIEEGKGTWAWWHRPVIPVI